ncbi:MAG: hypothetical protein AAGH68_16310 [Pseudomonadota bacterium]
MTKHIPLRPDNSDTYLRVVGLLGLIRVALFEGFGDRKYWDERYVDLFMPMLAKQLQGRVSTLEELTASMSNISHSTKIRLIEEARKDGLIEVLNRSQIPPETELDTLGARKVFFLSETMMKSCLESIDAMIDDIVDFAASQKT